MAKTCNICGKKLTFFSQFMTIANNKTVCYECLQKAGYPMEKIGVTDYIRFRTYDLDDIERKYREHGWYLPNDD